MRADKAPPPTPALMDCPSGQSEQLVTCLCMATRRRHTVSKGYRGENVKVHVGKSLFHLPLMLMENQTVSSLLVKMKVKITKRLRVPNVFLLETRVKIHLGIKKILYWNLKKRILWITPAFCLLSPCSPAFENS